MVEVEQPQLCELSLRDKAQRLKLHPGLAPPGSRASALVPPLAKREPHRAPFALVPEARQVKSRAGLSFRDDRPPSRVPRTIERDQHAELEHPTAVRSGLFAVSSAAPTRTGARGAR
jgi:hypothetical protein